MLEAELRKKTDIEDRVRAQEIALATLSTGVSSQFSANDRRYAPAAVARDFMTEQITSNSQLGAGTSRLHRKRKCGLRS